MLHVRNSVQDKWGWAVPNSEVSATVPKMELTGLRIMGCFNKSNCGSSNNLFATWLRRGIFVEWRWKKRGNIFHIRSAMQSNQHLTSYILRRMGWFRFFFFGASSLPKLPFSQGQTFSILAESSVLLHVSRRRGDILATWLVTRALVR